MNAFAAMMTTDLTAANDELKAIVLHKQLEVSIDAQVLGEAKPMIPKLHTAKSFDQAFVNNEG